MSVVIDANVVVASAEPTRRGAAARERLGGWVSDAEDVHAPHLFTYEVASALLNLEASSAITPRTTDTTWRLVGSLELTLHPPSSGDALMAIARRLQQRNAYDAGYIDLALQLGAELWTLDGRLARNARSVGFPVILLV